MKLLVILENHFFVDKDNTVWCDRIVDYKYLQRYLTVYEEIVVCGRTLNNLKKPEKFNLLISGENVTFRRLPDFYGIKGLIKNFFNINAKINSYVKEVDSVIYRAPTPLSLFTYKRVIKNNKVLGIEFMFSADKMIGGTGWINKILNKVIDYMSKKMCMSANGVSYVTEKVLQEKYPCFALKNGESDEYFSESYSTLDLNKENITPMNWKYDKKPNCFKIIHTGYMDTYRKGQDILIKAVRIVIDKGYNIQLTLIGDGAKKVEFEKLVKELKLENNVIFTGLINDKNIIFKKLKESHILVFPTEAEGLPRTIIEAMASGLPCIASPVDGIPELLSDSYLVPNKDIDGYANKIIELLNNWDKMIKISNENFEFSKKFENSILAQKRTLFYNKMYKLACKKNKG